MSNLSTKITINVLKHHVKDLLDVTETARVKKWALEKWTWQAGHETEGLLAIGVKRCFCNALQR